MRRECKCEDTMTGTCNWLAKQNSNAYRYMAVSNHIWKDLDGRIFSFEMHEPRFGFKPVNIDGTGWAHHYS